MESWGDIWRWIFGRLAGKPANFWWLYDGEIAGCSRPASFREVLWLREKGIRTIISLTRNPLPKGWIDSLDLSYHHFPVKNHTVPKLDLVKQVVEVVDNSLKEGKPVLVHCSAGKGRTGCMLAAWLMLSKRLASDEAISRIRMKKKGAIERQQEKFLKMTLGRVI